jgi:hypothetical protein
VKYLNIAAWTITLLGVAMTAIAGFLGLDALWLISGLLLILTGIVKVVMLLIWTRLARLGTDEHAPIKAL